MGRGERRVLAHIAEHVRQRCTRPGIPLEDDEDYTGTTGPDLPVNITSPPFSMVRAHHAFPARSTHGDINLPESDCFQLGLNLSILEAKQIGKKIRNFYIIFGTSYYPPLRIHLFYAY